MHATSTGVKGAGPVGDVAEGAAGFLLWTAARGSLPRTFARGSGLLVLFRAGVAGGLQPSAAGTRGSAASVPSMGAVAVNGHGARDGGVAATRCRLSSARRGFDHAAYRS
ncbi:hypothetical protein IQ07DRAFT_194856 [Pyrenochaeta sp. DS3sAY3a]|nr:hypothetical protein IQ07DRAFT_194856 [Pyrenochaeta sp. DS3sAY3a]